MPTTDKELEIAMLKAQLARTEKALHEAEALHGLYKEGYNAGTQICALMKGMTDAGVSVKFAEKLIITTMKGNN